MHGRCILFLGLDMIYFETEAPDGPTIHPPDDGWMNQWICSIGEAINYGENRRTRAKICFRTTSYVTNPARNTLESNSVIRSEKPATNRLNYSTVIGFKLYSFNCPQNQSRYKAATNKQDFPGTKEKPYRNQLQELRAQPE
jgi:hypothetical protein